MGSEMCIRDSTASEVASHARQGTGLAETAEAGRWVSSESVATENPRSCSNLDQKEVFKKVPKV